MQGSLQDSLQQLLLWRVLQRQRLPAVLQL
jgi:hypothetical protein